MYIEKEYDERVKKENRYFEYINTIRLLSRQIFTNLNPQDGHAKLNSILEELRNVLFCYSDEFSSRYLNEELRDEDYYEDGSQLAKLATIKELFASHLAMLWACVKERSGTFGGR